MHCLSRCGPRHAPKGYLIQTQISTKPLFGWKIAAMSLAGQRHIADRAVEWNMGSD